MNDAENTEASRYDEDYFLHGRASGRSLYEDYRWLPDLTLPMARCIAEHCGIAPASTVLDFGCARGYTVKALRLLGHDAYGVDVSEWAINNSDEDTRPFLTWVRDPLVLVGNYDWIVAKDVLEHVYFVARTITHLMEHAHKGVFAVIPLSAFPNGQYVIEDYERDVTHCQRHTLQAWLDMFLRPSWSVQVSYKVPGIKDNWYKPGWERGNGFITARRLDS